MSETSSRTILFILPNGARLKRKNLRSKQVYSQGAKVKTSKGLMYVIKSNFDKPDEITRDGYETVELRYWHEEVFHAGLGYYARLGSGSALDEVKRGPLPRPLHFDPLRFPTKAPFSTFLMKPGRPTPDKKPEK